MAGGADLIKSAFVYDRLRRYRINGFFEKLLEKT
jgi:hypothetical protein